MNNGHSTGYFPLERGARQGDPLSAYLFILVLEILFIQIRENEEIQGIRIDTQGEEVKISAYADDGNLFVPNIHPLNLIFQTCHKKFSSLKLNLEKSEACWIGSARGKRDKPVDCNWINLCTDKIRTLGVKTMKQIWLTPTIFSRLLVKLKTVSIYGVVGDYPLLEEYKFSKAWLYQKSSTFQQ